MEKTNVERWNEKEKRRENVTIESNFKKNPMAPEKRKVRARTTHEKERSREGNDKDSKKGRWCRRNARNRPNDAREISLSDWSMARERRKRKEDGRIETERTRVRKGERERATA